MNNQMPPPQPLLNKHHQILKQFPFSRTIGLPTQHQSSQSNCREALESDSRLMNGYVVVKIAKKPLISNRKELLGDSRKERRPNTEIYRFQSNLNKKVVARPRFELWWIEADGAGSSAVQIAKFSLAPFRKSGGRLPIYDCEVALRRKSQTRGRFNIHTSSRQILPR